MSTILEALKKAERERRLGQAPTRSSLLYQTPSRRRFRLGLIVSAIILLNAAVLAYGILFWHSPEPVGQPMPSELHDAPTASPDNHSSSTPEAPKVLIAEQPLNVSEPLSFRQLPQNLREQLSPLNLDLHVYGDAPERRFVLINSRRYQTGDWLYEGPLLEAITAEGVVLSFQGQRFRLSAQP